MRSSRRRFSHISKKAEVRAAHIWTHAMFGDGKPPQVVYADKSKRARREADPNVPSEHQSQASVISWWALACKGYGLPPFALAAVPNGGARDFITGALLKAEGVRAGFPDLIFMVKRGDFGGLFIEMKKRGNNPNPAQQQVLAYLREAGYAWGVCWTADEAIAQITNYLTMR